ncbi:hypothetical protein ACH3XW_16645 [Acanthocheilonema viteae]
MYAKQYVKPWAEHQGSNTSAVRGQRRDASTDSMHIKICGEFKRNPDEAIKDLELRMARTRERTAENGNATTGDHSRGHRHRHRNFESERRNSNDKHSRSNM